MCDRFVNNYNLSARSQAADGSSSLLLIKDWLPAPQKGEGRKNYHIKPSSHIDELTITCSFSQTTGQTNAFNLSRTRGT